MQRARNLLVAASLVAALMFLVSGPGTRLGLWDWQTGFGWMKWAMFLGFGVAVVALVFLVIPKARGPRPSLLVAAIFVGIMAGAPIISLLAQSKNYPYIHDVTTDTADPPAFVTLLAIRKASPNGADYGGPTIAAQQATAYPNVRPLVLPMGRDQAYSRVLDAVRAMGWDIAASDAAAGRIEATATTTWFGFKDDVVVRLTPQGTGTKVDVRSVSRVGESDIGANARRIQEFLSRLT